MKVFIRVILVCVAINLVMTNCSGDNSVAVDLSPEIEESCDTVYVYLKPDIAHVCPVIIDTVHCHGHNWNGNGIGHQNHEHSPDGMTCLMPGRGNIICKDSL